MATASPRGCCSFLCPPGGVYEPVPAACDCACAWVRGGVRGGERAGPALVPRLEPVHAHGARGGGPVTRRGGSCPACAKETLLALAHVGHEEARISVGRH